PFSRRVDQYLVERTQRVDAFARRLEKIGDAKAYICGEAVRRSDVRGSTHERLTPFDADDHRAAAGDRQCEVADPAEEVGDALARLRIEKRHSPVNQHPVSGRIDLRELGRSV